jgi:hypothetical protein
VRAASKFAHGLAPFVPSLFPELEGFEGVGAGRPSAFPLSGRVWRATRATSPEGWWPSPRIDFLRRSRRPLANA